MMTGCTVQVSNVSSRATAREIQDFFSFSGQVEHVDLRRDGEWSQVAYVTFTDPDSSDTAILLSGATIVDQPVSILPVDEEDQVAVWEHEAVHPAGAPRSISSPRQAVNKAQDMVTGMVAKGYVLGKDALKKAKSFDEKHRLRANASFKMSSINKKISLADRWNAGTSTVNKHVVAVNDKYQISQRTKSAFAMAQQGVTSAGAALVHNKYVSAGGSWVSGAFTKVAKAAGNTGTPYKAKEQDFQLAEMPRLRAEA